VNNRSNQRPKQRTAEHLDIFLLTCLSPYLLSVPLLSFAISHSPSDSPFSRLCTHAGHENVPQINPQAPEESLGNVEDVGVNSKEAEGDAPER